MLLTEFRIYYLCVLIVDGDDDNFINECIPEAEKGSIEHQLFLAKNYLKRAKNGIKAEENSVMAVYWLIKASRKANAEATGILEECLLDNIGNFHNNVKRHLLAVSAVRTSCHVFL